jgi:hypothetical protein
MATLKDELTYLRAELEMITSVIYNCMKDPDGTYETNNYFAAQLWGYRLRVVQSRYEALTGQAPDSGGE